MTNEEIVARAIIDAGYNPATAQGIAHFALASLSSAGRLVGEEWQLVPKEPTEEMIEAGRWPAEDDGPLACYRAMLASVPHRAPDATDNRAVEEVWHENAVRQGPAMDAAEVAFIEQVRSTPDATDWKARCEAAEKALAQWAREAPEMTREIEKIADVFQAKVDKVVAQRNAAQAENEKLRKLLARYRNETPLGHQPHMIAHEADKALALSPPPLSPEQVAADLGAYGIHITKDGERIAPEELYALPSGTRRRE